MRNCLMLIALGALTFFAAACESVNTTERAVPESNPEIVRDQRVEVDKTLRNKAQIEQVREARVGSNNLLKVQVAVRNTTSSRQEFNYRFEWFDENGMMVDTSMSRWTRASLAGKEPVWLSGVAPSPRVVDFRLKLLEPGS